MKKKWIFFALAPLFLFAEVQEEWLSETTFPVELRDENLKSKRNSSQARPNPLYRAAQEKPQKQEESHWTGFLDRLRKRGGDLSIVTNRKLRQNAFSKDEELEEELVVQEEAPKKEALKERQKPRERDEAFKKRRELLRKNNRRIK
jgi:hypothetical protein